MSNTSIVSVMIIVVLVGDTSKLLVSAIDF